MALDRTRRDGVDLDLGSDEAREVLDQRALTCFGDRVIRAVRIRDRDVLLAAEIGADIEDIAGALPLHERHDLLDQGIVGGEVGVQGVTPVARLDVHCHLLGAGDARIVDEVVDATERPQRLGDRLAERGFIGDIDVGEQAHAILRPVVADLFKLAHDLVAQRLERPFTACGQHHARARHREQPRELAADAGGTARHQHALAEMQAHQGFDPAEIRPRRAGRIDQCGGHIEIDLRHTTLGEEQPCALVRGEGEAVVLFVAPAHDLIRPSGDRPHTGAPLHFALIAPDANQLLEPGAQDIGVDVARAVRAVRQEDHPQPGIGRRALAPETGQRARHSQPARELGAEEGVDIGVAGLGERRMETPGAEGGQHDRTVQRLILGDGLQRVDERLRTAPVEEFWPDARIDLAVAQSRTRRLNGLLGAEAEDDLRAAARLRTRDGERISDLVARGDQHR